MSLREALRPTHLDQLGHVDLEALGDGGEAESGVADAHVALLGSWEVWIPETVGWLERVEEPQSASNLRARASNLRVLESGKIKRGDV